MFVAPATVRGPASGCRALWRGLTHLCFLGESAHVDTLSVSFGSKRVAALEFWSWVAVWIESLLAPTYSKFLLFRCQIYLQATVNYRGAVSSTFIPKFYDFWSPDLTEHVLWYFRHCAFQVHITCHAVLCLILRLSCILYNIPLVLEITLI